MKKIIYVLATLLIISSCEKKEVKPTLSKECVKNESVINQNVSAPSNGMRNSPTEVSVLLEGRNPKLIELISSSEFQNHVNNSGEVVHTDRATLIYKPGLDIEIFLLTKESNDNSKKFLYVINKYGNYSFMDAELIFDNAINAINNNRSEINGRLLINNGQIHSEARVVNGVVDDNSIPGLTDPCQKATVQMFGAVVVGTIFGGPLGGAIGWGGGMVNMVIDCFD